MEGIGIIFGGLALFVALAGLWFACDSAKRTEGQIRNLIDTHIKGLTERADESLGRMQKVEQAIVELEKRTASLGNDMPKAVDRLDAQERALDGFRTRLDDLENDLSKLRLGRTSARSSSQHSAD
jgi:chromosome segregation ATPase